jgi:hypothetical protein
VRTRTPGSKERAGCPCPPPPPTKTWTHRPRGPGPWTRSRGGPASASSRPRTRGDGGRGDWAASSRVWDLGAPAGEGWDCGSSAGAVAIHEQGAFAFLRFRRCACRLRRLPFFTTTFVLYGRASTYLKTTSDSARCCGV